MGTDIHAVFQARKGGIWEDIITPFDEGRWYFLFSWLADVRNGYGFAGVRTGEPIKPIANPRGLPEDFQVEDGEYHRIPSNAHRGRRAEWHRDEDADESEPYRLKVWMGDHSHTWLTAEEIIHAPNQPYQKCGIVSKEVYEKWTPGSAPEAYCGGIDGPGIKTICLEVQTSIGEKPEVPEECTHVRVGWTGGLWDVFSEFRDMVMKLKDEHGEVRMVFGFDS